METWEKVTTRSRVSIYRTNDPMETIGLKLDQDDRHTHIWKKKQLCPVTVYVDSQVSDRCPWATYLLSLSHYFGCYGNLKFPLTFKTKSGKLQFFENYCSLRPEKW